MKKYMDSAEFLLYYASQILLEHQPLQDTIFPPGYDNYLCLKGTDSLVWRNKPLDKFY